MSGREEEEEEEEDIEGWSYDLRRTHHNQEGRANLKDLWGRSEPPPV